MIMDRKFFVASCVFTEEYPELSRKIQAYITKTFNLPIIRCGVANYKVEEFENRMPDWYRDEWRNIKHFEKFPAGSTMVSICHNCSAIFEERQPEILRRMNFKIVELEENFERTKFCGYSLYQPQPARNPKLAPKRFLVNARGLFQEHTQAEKEKLMRDYCAQIKTAKVAAYCHYCVRGLKLGGKNTFHLAELLFE